jgi:hypothetical protein
LKEGILIGLALIRHVAAAPVSPSWRNAMAEKPTVSKLREDIDRGRAGSKIDAPDPAAAPLGTDDEAAGSPNRPDVVVLAHSREIGSSPAATTINKPDAGRWIYLAVIAIFAVLLIIAVLSVTMASTFPDVPD